MSLVSHVISIRVPYNDTDGQRRVHHANYLNYFEQGRVELLRARGWSYKELEESGLLLVVSEMRIKYFFPAEFDDVLSLETTVVSARGARIEHSYTLTRDEAIIVTAHSTIACIDQTGRVRRLPKELLQ